MQQSDKIQSPRRNIVFHCELGGLALVELIKKREFGCIKNTGGAT